MTFRNLPQALRYQAERLGPRTALRHKRYGMYHDVSWRGYQNEAQACAAALVAAGIGPGERVGLVAENRLEWLLADMGILAAAAVNVSPHAPLTARQIHFQLADSDARWLFISTREQRTKIEEIWPELPHLQGVVVFDDRAAGGRFVSWSGFLQQGRRQMRNLAPQLLQRENQLGPGDLATIMYTSGTTGNPKGVMLTHGNLISNTIATNEASPRPDGAILLSWLPFSHIYARTVDHYLTVVAGITMALAESAETVVNNLDEIRPTHMSSVPRFYEKLLSAVSSPDTEKMRRRLRDIFGPRLDWLSSGGAPLPPAIAEEFHKAGILVLQGYGLTESSPVISFNRKSQYRIDSVGQILPGVEVKIAPDGEVLTRGPHVMKGYWNDPQATAETIRDGWLYTGDIGELDSDGFLKITGRKKELMVLSNGKKVVPNFIEGLLLADECIDQVVIHGEGRNFLTALLVPHWENLRVVLKSQPIDPTPESQLDLSRHPAVHALLRSKLDLALKDVASWERVKKFVVLPHSFTVAGDELTVSLKLRRKVIFQKYKDLLDEMYRE